MRNPNGYGSVVYLGQNRRNSYGARITVGYSPDGKQIRKYIGYYDTRKEAMNALANYNMNPYDLKKANYTFSEVYEGWKKEKFPKISESNQYGYQASYKHCKPIHNTVFTEITIAQLQFIIDSIESGVATKKKTLVLFNQLYDYADKYNLGITRKLSKHVILPKQKKYKGKKIFTDKEIKLLWDNVGILEDIDIILILIYSGWRINELLNMNTENVNLDKRYFIGGNKTESSKNRIVPIHPKIYPFIEKRYDPNKRYLINNAFGDRMKYSNFKRERFDRHMELLNMNHVPHDTRHTTATLLTKYGADPGSIRRILGHAGKDITEQVYIHSDVDFLRKNIELIP